MKRSSPARGIVPALLFALFASALLTPVTVRGAAPASSAAPDALSGFRDLAAALRKKGPGLDTGLVLEYQLNRHTNACTGHQPEILLRLFGNGRLELLRTRSFAESDRSGPGAFQGKAGRAEWDSLFKRAAGMEWEIPASGLPMPGMSESNHVIVLNHAGRTARFDFSGSIPPGQVSISEGLGAVTGLLRPATADTAWNFALGASEAKYRNGRLDVRAVWSLRGRTPLRFRLPVPGTQPECGIMGLRWTLRPKDVQGFTAVPSETNWAYPQTSGKYAGKKTGKEAGAWKELQPGDSISVSMGFPLPKPKNVARVSREGNLMHLGIPVALPGSSDTSAVVTLFSDYFEF